MSISLFPLLFQLKIADENSRKMGFVFSFLLRRLLTCAQCCINSIVDTLAFF